MRSYRDKENYVQDWTVEMRRDHIYRLLLEELCVDGPVLMLGCNSGSTLELARETLGVDVVGLDINAEAVVLASPPLAVGDVRRLPFASGSFDAVLALDIIEHIYQEDMRALVDEVARVLVRRGEVLAFSPRFDRDSPSMTAMDVAHVQFFEDVSSFAHPWRERFWVLGADRDTRSNPGMDGQHDALRMLLCRKG